MEKDIKIIEEEMDEQNDEDQPEYFLSKNEMNMSKTVLSSEIVKEKINLYDNDTEKLDIATNFEIDTKASRNDESMLKEKYPLNFIKNTTPSTDTVEDDKVTKDSLIDETDTFSLNEFIENPIKIVMISGNPFIYNVKDFRRLRNKCHIVGNLVGAPARFPRQIKQNGLPLLLMNEEVTLCLEKKFARVVEYPELAQPKSEEIKEGLKKLERESYELQCIIAKEQRKKEIENMVDKIVIGKRRKVENKLMKDPSLSIHPLDITRESVLEEEFNKLRKLPEGSMLVETYKEHPFINTFKAVDYDWKYPSNKEEKERYIVFKDLWERKYWITSGCKFGADFLAYPGNPLLYHASLNVRIKKDDEDIDILDTITGARLSTNVNKSYVIASCDKEGKPHYISWKWAGV